MKITGDATEPNIAALLSPKAAKVFDYDDSLYVSFASIPLDVFGEGDRPLGVLVATSDRKNRFNRGNALILLHAADVLADLLILGHVKVTQERPQRLEG